MRLRLLVAALVMLWSAPAAADIVHPDAIPCQAQPPGTPCTTYDGRAGFCTASETQRRVRDEIVTITRHLCVAGDVYAPPAPKTAASASPAPAAKAGACAAGHDPARDALPLGFGLAALGLLAWLRPRPPHQDPSHSGLARG